MPDSVASPRCFGVVEQPDGSYHLWLEEIADEISPDWPLEYFGLTAQHLGQFNGIYLTEQQLPSASWLTRNWSRRLISANESAMAQLDSVLKQSLLKRVFPADVAAKLSRLWAGREIFLTLLERAPQTLCHRDAFRRNLFIY